MRTALLATLLLLATPVASAPTADLVLVAANTGTAAGGHVALRLGERVYHYQAGLDGLLQLERDSWATFELYYRVLENRTLVLHRLALDDEAFERIAHRFAHLHAVERVQLSRLEALALETRWIEAVGGEARLVPLPSVGLFTRESGGTPVGQPLRRAVDTRHGAGFLRTELTRVDDALREGALRVSDPGDGVASRGHMAQWEPVEAERRRDLLLLREALLALEEGRAVSPDAWIDPDADTNRRLEGEALVRLRGELQESVLRLLASPRADRGEPLLLAMARHRTMERSLALGRLVLLDPTPSHIPQLDTRALGERRDRFRPLAAAARDAYLDARALALGSGFDELSFRHLEGMAAFATALDSVVEDEGPVRLWPGGTTPPSRSGVAAVPDIRVPTGWREGALATAGAHEALARSPHEYRLLSRNCATELAAAIVSAFPDEDQAALALGGRLDPDSAQHFHPVTFARSARRSWSIAETRELPSWRRELVAGFAEEESSLLVRLRESNTWTARAYEGSIQDDPFVFFTDGVVVMRPLQGAVNLGYGLAHAALGALTFPSDGGRRALAGLRGAFFSLPELVGVNIRKGRYDLPPLGAES